MRAEVKFSKTEVEQYARERDLNHTQKVINLQRDVLTGFQDTHLYNKPYQLNRAFKSFGFGGDETSLEEDPEE